MATPISHLSHPQYRHDIDGLRAIAVLSVVAFHAFPVWVKGGYIGVDVFFVISGFLISTIIFENLEKGTFSFGEFYARRIKRIFPALTLVLVASLIIGWLVLLPDELNQLGKHVVAGAGFVSNLVLWSEAGYFDNSADTKPLLHLWSLGVEEQFYIIWPLLLWLASRQHFSLFTLVILVALFSFTFNINAVSQDPVATFYSPLTRFWELLCGTLLAWYSLHKAEFLVGIKKMLGKVVPSSCIKRIDSKEGRWLSNSFSAVGFLLLGYGFWSIDKELSFPGYWAVLPVLGAVLIILAGPEAWLNRKILSHRFFVWFGLISYPLYLWHWPILSFARIIHFDVPPLKFRVLAVAVSILLAWLTVKFIEKPFRFGSQRSALKVTTLCSLICIVAISGITVSQLDFTKSHTFEKLSIKRKGEHAIGSSLNWFRGKDDWLFLGNAYDNTVAKLKLSIVPSESQIQSTTELFSKLAEAALQHKTRVVLIVGPDKSSIYPEYLPDEMTPSKVRYSSFFLNKLKDIPNLIVYDPTDDLISLKNSEGILYWLTDTHWNNKGAFLAYSGFSKILDLPIPEVDFVTGSPHTGDLIGISKLNDFPLSAKDNWDVVWKKKPVWTEKEIPNEQKTTFGSATVVTNEKALSNQYVWVLGDSFAGALKQYFNASFKEVRYVGQWGKKLSDLPSELSKADRKPDLIVVVRVERSF